MSIADVTSGPVQRAKAAGAACPAATPAICMTLCVTWSVRQTATAWPNSDGVWCSCVDMCSLEMAAANNVQFPFCCDVMPSG